MRERVRIREGWKKCACGKLNRKSVRYAVDIQRQGTNTHPCEAIRRGTTRTERLVVCCVRAHRLMPHGVREESVSDF